MRAEDILKHIDTGDTLDALNDLVAVCQEQEKAIQRLTKLLELTGEFAADLCIEVQEDGSLCWLRDRFNQGRRELQHRELRGED